MLIVVAGCKVTLHTLINWSILLFLQQRIIISARVVINHFHKLIIIIVQAREQAAGGPSSKKPYKGIIIINITIKRIYIIHYASFFKNEVID